MLPLIWGNKVNFTINPMQLAYFTAQETPTLLGAGAFVSGVIGLLYFYGVQKLSSPNVLTDGSGGGFCCCSRVNGVHEHAFLVSTFHSHCLRFIR